MQQEYKQLFAVFHQTFRQAFAVLVPIGNAEDVRQSNVKRGNAPLVCGLSELIPVDDQLERFVHKTFQTASKEFPFFRAIAQRNLLYLAQQMDDTLLLCERLNPVVGAEEIGDQDPFEMGAENLLHHRTCPGLGQYVVSQRLAGEAPQPSQKAGDAPAAFVDV
jgi:hypothetical protein